MKIIQVGFKPRYPKADFAIWGIGLEDAQPGDVAAVESGGLTFSADQLKDRVSKAMDAGLRVSIGNVGPQLTFRRLLRRHPARANWNANVEQLLGWANAAYALAGEKLVLAPMDVDLSFDVATGGRLLAWAAAHHVPLIIANGFRWLFGPKAIAVRDISRHVPWARTGSPHTFPFTEISAAIKSSGAELWTGAGFAAGLHAGSLAKAEAFGFSGIYTTVQAWGASGHVDSAK
jgi:hypothetical protein